MASTAIRYCVGNTKLSEAIRTRKAPKSLRHALSKNIESRRRKNTKKAPQAPSAPLTRGGSGGAAPRGVIGWVEAIEVSEFAIAFASYIEGDTGVLIIPIVMAALPKRWAAVLGAYYWG